ncbi:hypothetical protein CsSME_00038580 [Camellia sinensis var. sinensis]
MGIFSLVTGMPGPSGFGSASTAEQVSDGIDATNLTAIVTGGASGIGLETARVLALRNAHVIIAARNMEAANEAKQLILKDNENARVDVLKLDLCSMKSIRAFANNFNALNLPLNILINNAGVMFCPYQLSEDGIEMQFATNHLGHFLLTNLLLDKMKDTARATGIEGRRCKYYSQLSASWVNNDKSHETFFLSNESFQGIHLSLVEKRPTGGSHNVLRRAPPKAERCDWKVFPGLQRVAGKQVRHR